MKVTGFFSSFHLVAAIAAGMLISTPVAAERSTDIFSEEYLQAHLVVGQTTPEQVERIYGEPTGRQDRVSKGGNSQSWRYVEGQKPTAAKRVADGSRGLLKVTSMLPASVRSKLWESGVTNSLLKTNNRAYELEVLGKGSADQGGREFSLKFESGVLVSYSFDR